MALDFTGSGCCFLRFTWSPGSEDEWRERTRLGSLKVKKVLTAKPDKGNTQHTQKFADHTQKVVCFRPLFAQKLLATPPSKETKGAFSYLLFGPGPRRGGS